MLHPSFHQSLKIKWNSTWIPYGERQWTIMHRYKQKSCYSLHDNVIIQLKVTLISRGQDITQWCRANYHA
jgi:hypothetical protein